MAKHSDDKKKKESKKRKLKDEDLVEGVCEKKTKTNIDHMIKLEVDSDTVKTNEEIIDDVNKSEIFEVIENTTDDNEELFDLDFPSISTEISPIKSKANERFIDSIIENLSKLSDSENPSINDTDKNNLDPKFMNFTGDEKCEVLETQNQKELEISVENNLENVDVKAITNKKTTKKKKHKKKDKNANIVQNSIKEELEALNNNLNSKQKKKKKSKKKKCEDKKKNDLFNKENITLNKTQQNEDNLLAENKKIKKHSRKKEKKMNKDDINKTDNTESVTDLLTENHKKLKKKKKKGKHKKKHKIKEEDGSKDKKTLKHKKKSKKSVQKNINEFIEVTKPTDSFGNDKVGKFIKKENFENEYFPTFDEHFSTNDDDDEKGYFYNFEEEELDFEPPILHGNGWPIIFTKKQKEHFNAKGIKLKLGTWTKREENILRRNWTTIIEKYDLKQPHVLLEIPNKVDPDVKKFMQAKKFYFQLARNLNDRSLYSCYLKARKLFYSGKEKEMLKIEAKDLQNLVSIYGNKWTKIGNKVYTDEKSINDIIRSRRNYAVKCRWSEEEDEHLIRAVQTVLKIADVAGIYSRIQWEKVAKLVPGRNLHECRQHWILNTCWKLTNTKMREWKQTDTICLIYQLYRLPIEKESSINWDELAVQFEKVASTEYLKQKWSHLKRKVPGYENKAFEDIVTYLYSRYLPSLLKMVGKSYIEEILDVR